MTLDTRTRRLVCLTGFMGSGKSTIARLLASQLGWANVDLDKRVVEAAGLSIPEIFARQGEPEFRRLEHEPHASRQLSGQPLQHACGPQEDRHVAVMAAHVALEGHG